MNQSLLTCNRSQQRSEISLRQKLELPSLGRAAHERSKVTPQVEPGQAEKGGVLETVITKMIDFHILLKGDKKNA